MILSEELFYEIIESIPETTKGKMFGALCIKAPNGKAAAIYWENSMLFKLGDSELEEVLKLEGAIQASHLYDTNKPMKGWAQVSAIHSDKWKLLTQKAIDYLVSEK